MIMNSSVIQSSVYMRVNSICKDVSTTEENFVKGYFSELLNIKTSKGYFLYELIHILELNILFKSSLNWNVFYRQ